MGEIEIPDCLINKEARDWYVKRMEEHYKRVNDFYNPNRESYPDDYPLDLPIGKFCDGGARASTLQEALEIQNPKEIEKFTLEDIAQLGIR